MMKIEADMPITLDPEKLAIVMRHRFQYKICRECGARNPPDAEKCRRCRSRNLRPKKFKKK
jgi:large subunit ribosomal protein L40e